MTASSRAIDSMVCFSLYTASRATTQAYRRLLRPWNLTYPQYLVLVELWDRGPASVSELCADLDLDSGTLSPLLQRMEAAGILTRSRIDADARVVTVALTARGEALQSEMAEVPGELRRCLNMPPAALRALQESLNTLVAESRQTR